MKKVISLLALLILSIGLVSATSIRGSDLIYGYIDGQQVNDVRSHLNINYNDKTGNIGLILFGQDTTLRSSSKITNVHDNGWYTEIDAEGNYATLKKGRDTEIIKNPRVKAYVVNNRWNGNFVYIVVWDGETGNARAFGVFPIYFLRE